MIVPSIHQVALIDLEGFKFFTRADRDSNYAKNCLNCLMIRNKMCRQFSVSFAFELTPGKSELCTENWHPLSGETLGGVQGALTLFCGGVAQTCHDDRVVELKEQFVVEAEKDRKEK